MAILKTSVSRKQKMPNFPKNEHFLPLDTHRNLDASMWYSNDSFCGVHIDCIESLLRSFAFIGVCPNKVLFQTWLISFFSLFASQNNEKTIF